TRSLSGRMFRATRENQEVIGKLSDRVLASLAGVRVVRSFALEAAEEQAFEQESRAYLEKNLTLARVRGSMGPIMGWINAVGVLVVFWYGATLVHDRQMCMQAACAGMQDACTGMQDACVGVGMERGDFIAFYMALQRLIWPLLALGFVLS